MPSAGGYAYLARILNAVVPVALVAGSLVALRRRRSVLAAGALLGAIERTLSGTRCASREPLFAERIGSPRGIDAWREDMAARIQASVPSDSARYVRALALGDTTALQNEDWEILRAVGLTHLIAISGFHVGLVAGFFALLASAVWRCFPAWARQIPRPQAAGMAAMTGAIGYAVVAGFALPTVRTALMIAVVVLARLSRRPVRAADGVRHPAVGVRRARQPHRRPVLRVLAGRRRIHGMHVTSHLRAAHRGRAQLCGAGPRPERQRRYRRPRAQNRRAK